MSDLTPGCIVNVTIKGVRVSGNQGPRDTVSIIADDGTHYVMPPQAAIERVAPEAWPPIVGDVWRSANGERWFAVKDIDDLVMVPSRMGPDPWSEYRKSPDVLLRDQAPLILVDRSPEEPPF